MRKTMAVTAAALAIGATARPAAADPTNRCYGDMIKGIASTWRWAHRGQVDFPPSRGALRFWIDVFGPGIGVSSVCDRQVLPCTALD